MTRSAPVLERELSTGGDRVIARRVPVLVGLAALLVVIAVWVVAFSPALGARSVTVRGNHLLSSAQVRNAARIGHNAPLIRLDTAAIRRRIDALPEVADAQVSVRYPSTVVITIAERTPVGYVADASGGYLIVDRTGTQYQHVATLPAALPHFVVPAGSDAVASGEAEATVASALTPAILARLADITATGPASITLVLRDGRSVRWGSAADSAQKASLLPVLLTRSERYFDVSDPNLVVARS